MATEAQAAHSVWEPFMATEAPAELPEGSSVRAAVDADDCAGGVARVV